MKIFLHFYNHREFKEVTVEADTTIGSLIKQYAPKDAAAPDFEEDLEVYLQGQNDELSKGATIHSLKLEAGAHLHFSKCKKIQVEVKYNGKSPKHQFSPSTPVGDVREWAIDHFNIDPKDAAQLALFLSESSDESIPNYTHIGSLTGYPTCGVTLYLSKKKTNLG